jgi:hypothetical protein
MVSNVGEPAAQQVIKDEDIAPAVCHQPIHKVTADKTGATGHENFHNPTSLLTV